MWKVEKTQPMDFNRSTIYSNEKNLKAQYDKYNQKKHVNDIKNQASFTYHFDKSRIDRSIVLAPTRNTKIENYIIQHNNSTKQRETIFSTPTVVGKTATYKPLDSKKHCSRQYNSDAMHMSQNPKCIDTRFDCTRTAKQTPNYKNQSSVGNPITFFGDKTKEDSNLHLKKKGEYTKDIYSVHGNFRPADREKGLAGTTNKNWANSQTRAKSSQNLVNAHTQSVLNPSTSQHLKHMQSSIFCNEFSGQNAHAKVYRNNSKVDDQSKQVMSSLKKTNEAMRRR